MSEQTGEVVVTGRWDNNVWGNNRWEKGVSTSSGESEVNFNLVDGEGNQLIDQESNELIYT